jgi:hypothetical protein
VGRGDVFEEKLASKATRRTHAVSIGRELCRFNPVDEAPACWPFLPRTAARALRVRVFRRYAPVSPACRRSHDAKSSTACCNEPETSLPPDLIAPLGRLIVNASQRSQLIVVTHSTKLVELLGDTGGAVCELVKEAGETVVKD